MVYDIDKVALKVKTIESNISKYYLKGYTIEPELINLVNNKHFKFFVLLGNKKEWFKEAF